MLKKLMNNWHYSIKARVVDGALLAKFDTAIEPVLLRLDLSRVQANTLFVRAVDGDYELGLAGYKMEFVPLARFETRDAAEAAEGALTRALFCGARPRRFRAALKVTLGIGLGIVISIIAASALYTAVFGSDTTIAQPAMSTPLASSSTGNPQADAALMQAMQALSGAGGGLGAGAGLGAAGLGAGALPALPAAPAPNAEPGVPMSADDFLNRTGGGQ